MSEHQPDMLEQATEEQQVETQQATAQPAQATIDQQLPAMMYQPSALAAVDQDPLANWLDKGRFDQIQRAALIFSKSEIVPKQFQGKPADCIIAFQLAARLNVDPFALMQKMYVVGGRPGLEAQMIIALVNERGPFTGPIQWKFTGTEKTDNWSCTAYATHKRTGELCEATVSWATVKGEGWLGKSGSKWATMPEQMFHYRTAAFLARRYCPEVIMGFVTKEELEDTTTVTVTPIESAPATPKPGRTKMGAKQEAHEPELI